MKFLTEDEAVRILPQSGKMHAGQVATKNGHTVGGDLIVAGVGITLNHDLADGALLAYDPKTQGVIVNEYLQTSDPDIYAAGDIATFPDPVFGIRRVDHWDTALSQGKAAGANMAGANEPYDSAVLLLGPLRPRYRSVGNPGRTPRHCARHDGGSLLRGALSGWLTRDRLSAR